MKAGLGELGVLPSLRLEDRLSPLPLTEILDLAALPLVYCSLLDNDLDLVTIPRLFMVDRELEQLLCIGLAWQRQTMTTFF